jgi:hypothetical protein
MGGGDALERRTSERRIDRRLAELER